MSNKKEIDTLIDLSRKVGQAFCNKDTYYEETSSNQIVQEWKYQDTTFRMNFPKTSIDEIAIKNCYVQKRRKLREVNLEAPSESSLRLVSNFAKVEELLLLDELWEELGANNDES